MCLGLGSPKADPETRSRVQETNFMGHLRKAWWGGREVRRGRKEAVQDKQTRHFAELKSLWVTELRVVCPVEEPGSWALYPRTAGTLALAFLAGMCRLRSNILPKRVAGVFRNPSSCTEVNAGEMAGAAGVCLGICVGLLLGCSGLSVPLSNLRLADQLPATWDLSKGRG